MYLLHDNPNRENVYSLWWLQIVIHNDHNHHHHHCDVHQVENDHGERQHHLQVAICMWVDICHQYMYCTWVYICWYIFVRIYSCVSQSGVCIFENILCIWVHEKHHHHHERWIIGRWQNKNFPDNIITTIIKPFAQIPTPWVPSTLDGAISTRRAWPWCKLS